MMQAAEVGQLQHDCGLTIAVEDYVESLHFGLMEVVHEWARGTLFAKITEVTDVQAGCVEILMYRAPSCPEIPEI